ncbi:MAG: hypothetical protein KF795_19140 [Labilithrix sp.]|nr:hypothetical protein [Labilithrix sp.]
MRGSTPPPSGIVVSCLALGLLLVAGCTPPRLPAAAVAPPAPGETPAAEAPSVAAEDGGAPAMDPVPKVIRRIAAEQKELVEQSQAMASELRDARGRPRALAEANELASELARLSAAVDGADSDTLDALVSQLGLLDTRISLLHEKLRTATDRTTAVLVE